MLSDLQSTALVVVIGTVTLGFIVAVWPKKKKSCTNPYLKEDKPEPKKQEPRLRTKKLQPVKKKFEIGRTQVELKLQDGKKFNIFIYGRVSQTFHAGQDEKLGDAWKHIPFAEANVSEFTVTNSLKVAQGFIQTHAYYHHDDVGYSSTTLIQSPQRYVCAWVDDYENPKTSYNGQIIACKILKSEKYEKEVTVQELVSNGT